MTTPRSTSWLMRHNRSKQLRETVLCCFGSNAAAVRALAGCDAHLWQKNYRWMDASGMALYLLHRLQELRCEELLPVAVLERFRSNAADNAGRTRSLMQEAAAIRDGFENARIHFAILKGFSLSPEAVPDPALRCQLDLDFLVAAEDAEAARKVLLTLGYTLDVVSGDTWEFKAGNHQVASIRDLYKEKPQRSAELHLVRDGRLDTRLSRRRLRQFQGQYFPVLCQADLFLEQALHLYSHVSSPFTRASWLLEFYRHVLARARDTRFWLDVKTLADDRRRTAVALGLVTLLAEECFGRFAPDSLRCWTVDSLSPGARLWVSRYGQLCLLSDFPGTKHYLLLQQALGSDADIAKKEVRRRLLPILWPRSIATAVHHEKFGSRLRRYRAQSAFVLSRLYFHVIQGARYLLEYPRWRRLVAEASR